MKAFTVELALAGAGVLNTPNPTARAPRTRRLPGNRRRDVLVTGTERTGPRAGLAEECRLAQGEEPRAHDPHPRDLVPISLEIRLLLDDELAIGTLHLEPVADAV